MNNKHWKSLTFYFRYNNRNEIFSFRVISEIINCTFYNSTHKTKQRHLVADIWTSMWSMFTPLVNSLIWCFQLFAHELVDGLIEIFVPSPHLGHLRLHDGGQLGLRLQQLSQCFISFRIAEWLQQFPFEKPTENLYLLQIS